MTTVAQSLTTFGYAPVLAFTKRAPSSDLLAYFSTQPDSQLAMASRRALVSGSSRRSGPQDAASGEAPTPGVRVYPRLGIVYGTVNRDGLAALKRAPEVSRVTIAPQPSLIRPVARGSATLRRNTTWGIQALGVPELWTAGLTGLGVKVAHLDTGIDADHPALREAVGAYAEFDVSGLVRAGATPRDSDLVDGHGTHTAATVAGRAVRGRHVGVAPGASLYSGMVIEGGDVIARILSGMEWAVTEGVKVVSLSLGIRGYVNDFLGIVDALRDNGVFPVVAVGNEGPGTSRSPGNYPHVVSIGYLNEASEVADDSSSQRFPRRSQPLVPDLVAPGEGIISAAPGGGWRTLSGSSMATPHVTGLAALLLEAHPTASVSKLERAILASAELGNLPRDRANRGAVNAPRALAALDQAMRRSR